MMLMLVLMLVLPLVVVWCGRGSCQKHSWSAP
jgi:uncharacterized membrane protein YqaE (UPF0057 family)